MKYVKVEPFEKHIEEALPDHPSPLYFILIDDPFERYYLAKRVAKKLNLPLKDSFENSLFSEKGVVICDEVEEEDLPLNPDLIAIVTGKKAPPFFKKREKEGVTLDLTGEKPWDRKGRLQRWLQQHAREEGKNLSIDGAAYLAEFSHADFARLYQELEKTIIYAGDEKTITLKMIQTICKLDHEQNGWQLSEAVVWGGKAHLGETDLYTLIGQLRYQLQLGLQIASGKEPSKSSPKKIDKVRKADLQATYYVEGLKELFNLEMKMRSNISNQKLLFDHFRAKLAARRHALSSP
ncbi:MAG: hypothetical protein KDK76_07150 [Chlamydiia bacterium]|nr:hypothetical protein [Chlamydiia bacterium]